MDKRNAPTCENMWVDVKGVVDRLDAASPEVPLAEGEGAASDADPRHISVTTQSDLRQSQVLRKQTK